MYTVYLDAQLILSTFHQPLHVSGVSRPIIKSTTVCIQQLVFIILFGCLFYVYWTVHHCDS